MAFARGGLRGFLGGGEKSPPPVFVGRRKVIQDIEGAGRRIWNGRGASAHGIAGMTRIIQGAPGAGKSSILAELRARSRKAADASGAPRVLDLSSETLREDLPSVIGIIAAAGGLSSEGWRRLSGGVSAAFAALGGELSWRAAGTPPHLTGLSRMFPPPKWKVPVIVAVDEAQRFAGGADAAHALFFQGVHDGKLGFPLTLVLAGLGDTRDRPGRWG